jgi:uncharacterized membrane protein
MPREMEPFSPPHGGENKETPRRFLMHLRNTLIAGVLVSVPLIVTIVLLRIAYQAINNVTAPIFRALGIDLPGLGFISTVLLVLAVGFMATNVFGRKLIEAFEGLLLRVPLIAPVYGAVKQALDSFKSIKSKTKFKSVAYVEYPSPGCKLIGFVTGTIYDPVLGGEMTTVFLPTSPNPMTGFVLAIPPEKVIESGLTLEQASKVIVSAGLVAPGLPGVVVGKGTGQA